MFSPTKSFARRALAIGSALTLTAAVAAPLASAEQPTLTNKITLHAGQTTPWDIPGNHLHKGQTIRKGYDLIRYTVNLKGDAKPRVPNSDVITMRAPKSSIITGLGMPDVHAVGFSVRSDYNKRTLKVGFYQWPGNTEHPHSGYIYMLVKHV